MKKLFFLSFILIFVATAGAQTVDKKWGFGAGLGAYGTIDNSGIGLMPELYLSRYLSPRFDIMLKNDLGLFRSDLINDLDLANPLLNLRLKLSNETTNFRPYLFAGPGFLADNNESGVNFNLGLGAKYYFTPKTAFYLDAGYISGIEITRGLEKVTDNFWKATLGMEFDFGKTKDSDMDGVSDKKDKCPDTPAGVAVDADGCPLDTDGDGVPDHLDDCPTVAGLTSLKGCPDRDKDGVADKDDDCPDEFGFASLKGCPDADGDGVADKDDKCPDTPKGWKVDASGCPFDTDKDGLFDEEDDCPTVAGPKENKGCPVKVVEKKEITIDQIEIQNIQATPIHFLSDKSYVTDYSKGILDKLIKTLNENKDYNVNIFGHTDSQGSDGYNINLAKERIESTIKYLESKGISANRIIHQKAFGKAKPIASNKTPEGRLQNRRVEFEIFKMK
ncbi:MAG: OmpA family protein [Bacteroidota bacterium]|nr:OmpA family protein [Bacteroidota bacterium]